jgi:predicted nucleic acid-binding protein
MIKIYFDACCINRPFDDQSYPRIHLESEAVLLLLMYCEKKYLKWVGSDILDYEIDQATDLLKKEMIKLISSTTKGHIALNETIRKRANEIQKWKISSFDSLHVASAEYGKVDIFLTTDDKLLSKLRKHKKNIQCKADNPLNWIQEVKIV